MLLESLLRDPLQSLIFQRIDVNQFMAIPAHPADQPEAGRPSAIRGSVHDMVKIKDSALPAAEAPFN